MTDPKKLAEEIVGQAISYGMGASWPNRPPQNPLPLPICEGDLTERITKAIFTERRRGEKLVKALRAWLNTNPESVEYPTPMDCDELREMLKALAEWEKEAQ